MLSDRDLRALKLGGAILVPALLIRFATIPFAQTWMVARESIEAKRGLLKREMQVISAKKSNEEFTTGMTGQLRTGYRRVFTSDQPNLATANALAYLDSIAQASRVAVTRSAGRATEVTGANLTSLTVDFEGASDFEGILSFLHGVETGTILVRVPSIAIEAPASGEDPNGSQNLSFKAELKLFFASESTKQASGGV